MSSFLTGLHHVTATVDAAQADLDFCVRLLGLRLVKQTVNFDNERVFHFYYGDEHGTPGTIWTTFPYRGHGVRVGTIGAGQVVSSAFSVPASSLDAWRSRLVAAGLHVDETQAFDETRLVMRDPSGLIIELVGTAGDTRAPWAPGDVTADMAITGLHSVTLLVHEQGATIEFLQDVLGFVARDQMPGRVRLALGEGGTGRQLDVRHDPDAVSGINGIGTVHHVALAITDEDAQRRLRDDLERRGVQVTPVRDRQYFRSIYFREPGGVLIEVATIAPGFTVDEPLASLGTALKLPPWQEPSRRTIEAGLPVIQLP